MAQSKKKRKEKKPKKAPASAPESSAPKGPTPFRPPGFGGFDRGPSKGPSGPLRDRPTGRRH